MSTLTGGQGHGTYHEEKVASLVGKIWLSIPEKGVDGLKGNIIELTAYIAGIAIQCLDKGGDLRRGNLWPR